jgi:hypothetical protein
VARDRVPAEIANARQCETTQRKLEKHFATAIAA